jgi:transposase InsO family protein
MERISLKDLYYDPNSSASFGGVEKLFSIAKSHNYSKKDVQDWLATQDTYSLHRPVRWHFSRNRTLVSKIDDVWQMDLVDMQAFKKDNNGYGYLLTCIDIFSKYAWAIPIRRKTSDEMGTAFNKIIENRKPIKVQSDRGSEFLNKSFQDLLSRNGIGFYTTFNETKASVVERFNRTLKTRMWRYFTHVGRHRYIDIIDKLVNGYNTSFHRSIGMAPVDVTAANSAQVFKKLYPAQDAKKPNLRVGDSVRISKAKSVFDKGYLPNWTSEIFKIVEVLERRTPPVYILEDVAGEKLKGTFYEQELQKVDKKDDDLWRIEKVIKKRVVRGKTQYLVKWEGYEDKHNSWVDNIHSLG